MSEPWRYKWFVDGVQQTPTNIDYWKNNGYIDTDGKTIKKRVPEREYRSAANETKGQNQQRPRTFSTTGYASGLPRSDSGR